MVINCELCHAALEVPDSLADGQPVRCPYCHCRFVYASRGREGTEDGEAAGQSSTAQTSIDGSAELWATVLPFCRHVLSSWVSAWKSMFDFGGRMPRREYLEFIVFQLLGMALLFHFIGKNSVVRDNLVSALLPPVRWIMLFTLISATVRRLHDMNRSGKWLLLLLIPIAFDPVRNWLPWIAFGVVVGVGLIRTRDEGNTYLPLQSIRWPQAALILILALGVLMTLFQGSLIERVGTVRECDETEQYCKLKEWYNYQLDYNGLRETRFTDQDGTATLFLRDDGGESVVIQYMYGYGGMIGCSRSLRGGFAEDLIKVRLFIENYEKYEARLLIENYEKNEKRKTEKRYRESLDRVLKSGGVLSRRRSISE